MRCSYCYNPGHNRTTCEKLKDTIKKNPSGYQARLEEQRQEKKARRRRLSGPRKCGFCSETGHTRRTCLKAEWTRLELTKSFEKQKQNIIDHYGDVCWGTLIHRDGEGFGSGLLVVGSKTFRSTTVDIGEHGQVTVGVPIASWTGEGRQVTYTRASFLTAPAYRDVFGRSRDQEMTEKVVCQDTPRGDTVADALKTAWDTSLEVFWKNKESGFAVSRWQSNYYALLHQTSDHQHKNVTYNEMRTLVPDSKYK
jgi:hypothetical protein